MRITLLCTAVVLLTAVAACSGNGVETAASADPTTAALAPNAANATGAPAAAPRPQKRLPSLDYLQQIPLAYRVANEHPDMLAQIPCYCPCELYGHGGVIDCYRSQHAAGCATCLEEAVLAGKLLEQAQARGPEVYTQIAAEVKNRYRTAIVRSHLQKNDMPNLQSNRGKAFLAVCSDCHQPPHPAMYTADNWRRSLSRMEAHANQRGVEMNAAQWEAAVSYLRSTASQFTPEEGDNYRAELARAVEHLKRTEGESVYYPSPRDKILAPEWFERMVQAYRLARDIPAEVLAATPIDDPGCSNLLQCLNSTSAVTSEAAVEAVFRIAADRAGGD